MDLERTSVVVRERTTAEAVDLGVLMGRRWWVTSVLGTLMVGGPLFLLANSLLWEAPALAALAIWWLKPLFERVPLAVIGRGFFGEAGGPLRLLRQCDWPPGEILLDLTWRRLSPHRSYFSSIGQLESLRGGPRRGRVAILGRDQRYAAAVLTLLGLIIELLMWGGVYTFLNLVIPDGLDLAIGVPDYELAGWPLTFSNGLLFLIQITVMPFYVGMGFSLYVKRRIDLEAWDLDLAFRRLRRRLLGPADGDAGGAEAGRGAA